MSAVWFDSIAVEMTTAEYDLMKFSTYESVSNMAINIVFLIFPDLGIKLTRWGKNPPGGHK